MSKAPPTKPDLKNTPDKSRLDRRHRHSLQPSPVTEVPPGVLRHTQSHRYDSQGKKKKKAAYTSQIPSIMENESSENELENGIELIVDKNKSSVVYETEKKSAKAPKPKTKESGSSSNKTTFVYDNAAFEGSIRSKRSSAATSSRAPSVQSLEIVREQYCCCAKRTKCERTLLTTVIILSITVIVLIIVIIFVAKRDEIRDLRRSLNL